MPTLTIRGLNQIVSRLHATLEDLSREQARRESVLEEIQEIAASLKEALAAQRAGPADLTRPSQQGLLWIQWLAEGDHLALHVDTLGVAGRLASQTRRSGPPIHVRLYPGSSLARARQVGGQIEVSFHQGFAGAPVAVLQALIEAVLARGKKVDMRAARLYARGREFQAIQQAFSVAAPLPPPDPQGRFYHLEESYRRVNQAYFGGQIAMPR
ncbi:MAG TPA: hypothetical protein VMT46_13375, partial [Anaerolineaceae bacterium]|nr:hypothetical protein [Anaerolineaceae bacterium]